MTKSHFNGHPATVFSPVRAKAWEEVATDEEFYRYLDGLINVYAKRLYKANPKSAKPFSDYEPKLIEDYKKWKEENPW